MKILHIEQLVNHGAFSKSAEWKKIRKELHAAVERVDWPHGSGKFTIYPKEHGNGVTLIKKLLMAELEVASWKLEEKMDIATSKKPGKLDAILYTHQGPMALEWETGNISSSHRALNKMALGLLKEKLVGGTLIVPTRELYRYLTDRIGNWDEIAPYVDLWKALPIKNGVLEVAVVQYDATSTDVKLIPKGTDGRARR